MPGTTKRAAYIPIDQRPPETVRAVILARVSDEAAKDTELDSQVAACEAFVARKRWRLVAPPFREKRSGFYHVRREGLEAVEALISQRAIDVVVMSEPSRLARDDVRRGAALYHARKYGVEYRFVSLGENGKIADDDAAQIYAAISGVMDRLERDRIAQRTMRGRIHRAERGIPTGGSGGAPFGYQFDGEPPYQRWARNDAEAATLLWMFTYLDEDERHTVRGLVRELNARGITTRKGRKWSTVTVLRKLRNPLYCGRARLLRWKVAHVRVTDEDSGEDRDMRVVKQRAAGETLPIAEGAVPVLIPPDLFDRVQQRIDHNRTFGGRLERVTSALPADATLLHDGIAVCARCGKPMSRKTRKDSAARRVTPAVYYFCSARSRDVEATCTPHSILAAEVDDLTLRLVASGLSEPETLLQLATAAEARRGEVEVTLDVAQSRIEAATERLAQIEGETDRLRAALAALAQVPGMEGTIRELRDKLDALDVERAEQRRAQQSATPRRQRAEERLALLQRLFTTRDWVIDLAEGTITEGEPELAIGVSEVERLPDGTLREYRTITVTRAAALLAMDVAELERQMPVTRGQPFRIESDDGTEEWDVEDDTVRLEHVVYLLLRRLPHARLRSVLKDLAVRVEISHPRPKEIRAAKGLTPLSERVTVQLGDLRLRLLPLATDGTAALSQGGHMKRRRRSSVARYAIRTADNTNVRTLIVISMAMALGSPPLGTR